MLLSAEALIDDLSEEIALIRAKLDRPPLLALVWIGNDKQTEKFVNAKKKKAAELGVEFQLHHFESVAERQLSALLSSLNESKKVDGIIIQLPLPKNLKTDRILPMIDPAKDVDGLASPNFPCPTPSGVVALLQRNGIDLAKTKTVILGGGRLVGGPLAEIFQRNGWPFEQITTNAEQQKESIKKHDLLIAATGVEKLVTADYVHNQMTVVDASGVDVDFQGVEKIAKRVTPQRGAIGPLTVLFLLKNTVIASELRQDSSKRSR